MTDLAFERVRVALESFGSRVTGSGAQLKATCPAHDDRNPSLSITDTANQVLVYCHSGCPTPDVLAAVGLAMADLYDRRSGAEYRYSDGRVVHRTPDKKFRQSGQTRGSALYQLDKIRTAVAAGRTVYVVEGEKDADALGAVGAVATCSAMGAGKARKADWSPLKGAQVVLVADRDDPGERHAGDIAEILTSLDAQVRVVRAAEGKDAADHVAAGHSLGEFVPFDLPGNTPGNADQDTDVSAGRERFPFPDTEAGNTEDVPLYADVAALFDGGLPDPPEPVLLHRDDGRGIFYARQVNYLFGDPESGKTLVAQAASAEALKASRRVVFVDIDHNGLEATVCRFLDMDVPEETLRDLRLFRYVEPEDKAHLIAVIADLKVWRPAVAVVDSVGELLPLLNLSSNSPDDFTVAHSAVLKPLAMAGAAVLAIDHLPKSNENKANGPTGTAAKRRAIGGVSIRVTIEDTFAPGQGGSAYLTINKDRHGGLRKHCPPAPGKEQVAGLFVVAPGDDLRWHVKAPAMGDAPRADRVDPYDLAALDELEPPPSSVRDVRDRLHWRTDRATRTLREWRSRRSPSVSGKRETQDGQESGTPLPLPVPGNAVTPPPAETAASASGVSHRVSQFDGPRGSHPLHVGRGRHCTPHEWAKCRFPVSRDRGR